MKYKLSILFAAVAFICCCFAYSALLAKENYELKKRQEAAVERSLADLSSEFDINFIDELENKRPSPKDMDLEYYAKYREAFRGNISAIRTKDELTGKDFLMISFSSIQDIDSMCSRVTMNFRDLIVSCSGDTLDIKIEQ